MKQYPSIPHAENAPAGLFESGHLWLLEKVDGALLRFQLQDSGLVRFGDRDRVYDDPDTVPDPYQHAVRHVREHLDREALRTAVDDVEDVVFFGEATHRHTIAYDWAQTPSFLGFDVWSDSREAFRPPDAAEQIFDRLGLQPVNAFEREQQAQYFDPDSYTFPESAWYDGPPEGVVIRNKRGQRAILPNPDVREADGPDPVDAPESELAERYATTRRFERVVDELEASSRPVTFDALYDRVLKTIVREAYGRLYHARSDVDMGDFRSEVAALTRAFLDDRVADR
ncbi:RNA ligase family protein [Halomicroarcula sp. F13]|uniref:RNA ligase family protein n=1 Tax=Haloarcula rubra TaxID=2487747 RepID=A0AAW4PW64_9EURY|nr:RNA ligase family protein [Halomicroarcula rubra]MBX0325412.1 RNA ligase family protein [Halomicroarcula rubra]